jgi:hypothetical protein
MAQYISVYLDDEKRNYNNKGLYHIVAFIGKQSYGEKKVSDKEAYKKGKKVINSKLRKRHLTTIEKLVVADRKKYVFNYDQKTVKPVWKIHRVKARKVFGVIHDILRKLDNSEINILFNNLCKKYGFSSTTDAAGSPYYTVLKDEKWLVSQSYDKAEINDLKKCAKKIGSFSDFH